MQEHLELKRFIHFNPTRLVQADYQIELERAGSSASVMLITWMLISLIPTLLSKFGMPQGVFQKSLQRRDENGDRKGSVRLGGKRGSIAETVECGLGYQDRHSPFKANGPRPCGKSTTMSGTMREIHRLGHRTLHSLMKGGTV